MSDSSPFGFGQFVPGFDFLQSLVKGASSTMPQMPPLSSWVAPTVSVQELQKRIDELKAVQFWLEQNARALAATLQALEVQKMTLATFEGMNFSMGDMSAVFSPPAADTLMDSVHKAAQAAGDAAQAMAKNAARMAEQVTPAAFASQAAAAHRAPDPVEEPAVKPAQDSAASAAAGAGSGQDAKVIDPMQWWGALTQQFQQIATDALSDAAKHSGLEGAPARATDMAREAFKTATDMASQMAQGVQAAHLRPATTPKRAAASKKPSAPKMPDAAQSTARKPVAKKSPARATTPQRTSARKTGR